MQIDLKLLLAEQIAVGAVATLGNDGAAGVVHILSQDARQEGSVDLAFIDLPVLLDRIRCTRPVLEQRRGVMQIVRHDDGDYRSEVEGTGCGLAPVWPGCA